MAQNQSIEYISLCIDRIIPADHFKRFISSIQKLKSVEFKIDCDDLFNEILNSIYMPTKSFTLNISNCSYTNEFHQIQIELLKITNVNKLIWTDPFCLFGGTTIADGLKGFGEFCEHVIRQNTLKSFKAAILIDNNTLPYIAKMISKCRTLHEIDIEFDLQTPIQFQDLLDALTKSNLRRLTVTGLGNDPKSWNKIGNTIKSMEKLTHLSFAFCYQMYGWDPIQLLSESIRDCTALSTNYIDESVLQEITLQNKKLQNERVRAIITPLFNIARDTSLTIPRDIWIVIMSFVSIPGVSLDFGTIAHSIFKDMTIRRVINKPIRSSRVVINK